MTRLILAGLLLPLWAAEPVRVEDVIPLTESDLRGHKMLFNEGWFVVTSSSRALAFAREHSRSSRQAITQALAGIKKENAGLGPELKTAAQEGLTTTWEIESAGHRISSAAFAGTRRNVAVELKDSRDAFDLAAAAFVRGNLSIRRRTEQDRRALAEAPGRYFKDLRGDFGNVYELAQAASRRFGGRLTPAWNKAFRRAGRDFQAEYDRSGREPNALAALGPILAGWLKAFYHGLAAPAAKTLVKTTAVGAVDVVFLPVSAGVIVSGRTIESLGLTVYYAGKTGVAIVSPTVEGGLLCGLSLLGLSAVPPTLAVGGSLGAINQVAFSAAAPVAGGARAAGGAAAGAGTYVAFVGYDALKGVTTVLINQAESGLVLGYNALTMIPTQTLLGLGDAAVFLAWDGPRLALAAASGRLRSGSVGELPVGTVVDLKELRKEPGVKVEVLSNDPALINRVLEKIPDDARVGDAPR